MKYLHISFLCLAMMLCPDSAFSQENNTASRYIILDASIDLKFLPVSAYVFVSHSGDALRRIKALLVSPYSDQENGGGMHGKWLAGIRIPIPLQVQELSYSVLFIGEKGESTLSGPMTRRVGLEVDSFKSIEELHAHITKQKDLLEELRGEASVQSGELNSLRSDVDLITDINRLVEVREESFALGKQIRDLDKDFSEYEHALSLVSSSLAPKNLVGREADLAAQLPELNAALKGIEEKEKKAKESAPTSIEKKRALIEETKDEDEASLVRRLALLKRHRMKVEREN